MKTTNHYGTFLLKTLGYKPGITLTNLICNVCLFSYQAAVAYFVRLILNILDSGERGSALSTAGVYLLGILGVSLGRVVAILLVSYLDNLRSYYYQNRTRVNLLRSLYRQTDISAVAGNSGRLFEVMDDDVPAAVFPAELFTEVAGYCIYTLVTLVLLLSINWQITLFIFLPLSAAIFGVQRLSDRIKARRRQSREAHDEISTFMSDVAGSVLSIKTAGAADGVLEEFSKKSSARRAAVLQDARFQVKLDTALKLAVFLGTVIMMFIAARLMSGGSFPIGDFSIFVASLGTLGDCVNRIVEITGEIKKGEVSYERIMESLQAKNYQNLLPEAGIALKGLTPEPEIPLSRQPLKTFTVKNLCFSYGKIPVLQNRSLEIGPGELVVIASAVGTGKSTLLNILSGTQQPDSGTLLWNGEKVPLLPPNVAVAYQNPRFFSGSIRENLYLGSSPHPEQLQKALSLAALEETIHTLPAGLETNVGTQGAMLSGGQRQRLALARMFLRDAELYLVDDCLSALDEATQFQLRDNIKRHLAQTGHSMILATNLELFLEAADKVVQL